MELKSSIHKYHLNGHYIVLDVNSGSVHLVDEIVYDLLDAPDCEWDELKKKYENKYNLKELEAAAQEIRSLREEGLLFSEPVIFDPTIFQNNNVIKAMCLHVAHDCNLKCRYCFAAQGNFNGERCMMTEETGKKAFDFLVANSGNRRHLEVDFFGGEPLMNFEVVKKLVAYGRELEKIYDKIFRFTLTTNCILLNEEIMDYLNEHMSNVVLSLDGRRSVNDYMRETISGKGSYDLIVPKIKRFVEKRGDKDYYIRGTFTNKNLDFSKDILEFFDQGFEKVSVEPVVTEKSRDYAIREEHLDRILKEYEDFSSTYIGLKRQQPNFQFFHYMIDLEQGPCLIKRSSGCGAGNEYVAITPEGDIYPCHQFVGESDFCLGNLNVGIVNADLRDRFKNSNVFTKESCRECWAKFYCSGGCHANAYYEHGKLNEVYEIGCEMEKKRIECAISVLASLQEG